MSLLKRHNHPPDLFALRQQLEKQLALELDTPTLGFTADNFRVQARPLFDDLVKDMEIHLTEAQTITLWENIASEFIGYGPVDRLLDDEKITYIHMLSDVRIFITKGDAQEKLDEQIFDDRYHYLRTVHKLFPILIANNITPLVNILRDGSTAHCLFPQTDYLGPFVVIQKSTQQPPP